VSRRPGAAALGLAALLAMLVRVSDGRAGEGETSGEADEAAPPAAERARLEAEVASLRAQLSAAPDNVDLRMALASRLAWLGQRDQARHEALAVIGRAPGYWDAYLLLARLDAWDGDRAAARRRLAAIFAVVPDYEPAVLLEADTYLWEDRPEEARRALERLGPRHRVSAELLVRLGQIEQQRLHPWAAHRYAAAAVSADPDSAAAHALLEATRRFLVDVTTELEHFPVVDPDSVWAYGVTATAVATPRGRFSLSGELEYRRRFATDNVRAALRADWRATRALTLTGYGRAGWVEVLPLLTLWAGAELEPRPAWLAGLRYAYDRFAWPGRLHRLTAGAGAPLSRTLRADAAYTFGLLDHCGDLHVVHAAELRLGWERGRWLVAGKYAYGSELDRPQLSAFGSDSTVCPGDPGAPSTLALATIRSHELGVHPQFRVSERTTLTAGYALSRRDDATYVHAFHLGVRARF
jgi:tetratricopeptide (TPR) repeat protein